jgi:DNA-binding response OmpR family regulator
MSSSFEAFEDGAAIEGRHFESDAKMLSDAWPTILIVEDDLDQAMLFEMFLRGHGFTVISVSSIDDAYSCLSSQDVDVVISDLCFPTSDGIEFLQELREHRVYGGRRPAQIIALTACPDNLRQAALSQVADMYCEKRDAKRLLLGQVRQLLG